jgi:hypothetical protein
LILALELLVFFAKLEIISAVSTNLFKVLLLIKGKNNNNQKKINRMRIKWTNRVFFLNLGTPELSEMLPLL